MVITVTLDTGTELSGARLPRDLRLHVLRFGRDHSGAPHAHHAWGIALPLEGLLVEEGRRLGSRYAVAGEALVIPPGAPHRNRAGRRGCRHLLVETGPDPDVTRGRHLSVGVRPLPSGASGIARKLHRALVAVMSGSVPGPSEPTVAVSDPHGTLLAELSLLVLDAAAAENPGSEGAAPPWLNSIRERVTGDPARPPTLAELADTAGVHPSTVLRRFRAAYGVTPAGLARRRRLEEAALRLRTSGDDISRIALELGFADQSHLTRAFRSRFGLPPAAYRAAKRAGP